MMTDISYYMQIYMQNVNATPTPLSHSPILVNETIFLLALFQEH